VIDLAYTIEKTADFSKQLIKLTKKDRLLFLALKNRIESLLINPYSSKPLRFGFSGNRRIHVNGCFVLIFEIDDSNKKIIFKRVAHHDDTYERDL